MKWLPALCLFARHFPWVLGRALFVVCKRHRRPDLIKIGIEIVVGYAKVLSDNGLRIEEKFLFAMTNHPEVTIKGASRAHLFSMIASRDPGAPHAEELEAAAFLSTAEGSYDSILRLAEFTDRRRRSGVPEFLLEAVEAAAHASPEALPEWAGVWSISREAMLALLGEWKLINWTGYFLKAKGPVDFDLLFGWKEVASDDVDEDFVRRVQRQSIEGYVDICDLAEDKLDDDVYGKLARKLASSKVRQPSFFMESGGSEPVLEKPFVQLLLGVYMNLMVGLWRFSFTRGRSGPIDLPAAHDGVPPSIPALVDFVNENLTNDTVTILTDFVAYFAGMVHTAHGNHLEN